MGGTNYSEMGGTKRNGIANTSHTNNFYSFYEGKIHYKLFKKAKLPKEKRIDAFIIKSFFFINGYKKYLSYLLFKENLIRFTKRKNSYYHYISILNWRSKNYKQLTKEAPNIKKINPQLFERYKLPNAKNLKEKAPTITRLIDNVLSNGKITEKSIFNLAISEKLVFIHKYGEGFTNVYKGQITEKEHLNKQITKWKKSKNKKADRNLLKQQKLLKKLNDNWLRVPIGLTLEGYGFQKLFSKMDGVYVLPLSLLPKKYHNNIDLFLNSQIVDKATEYVEKAYNDGHPFIEQSNIDLKYLILAHIIPVHEIQFLSQKRNFEISSPTLSRMLLTSFLTNDTSNISSLYIHDIVRNVDFLSLLKNNKTDTYIRENIEPLKQILWDNCNADLYKPFTLSNIIEPQILSISDKLMKANDNIQKFRLVKRFKELFDFYRKLDNELKEIKK